MGTTKFDDLGLTAPLQAYFSEGWIAHFEGDLVRNKCCSIARELAIGLRVQDQLQKDLCVKMVSSLDRKREDCQIQFVIRPGWRFEYHIFEIHAQ